jgi:hypothetical protein
VKPQFRYSGKMVEEATTDGFLCVLCGSAVNYFFKYGCSLYARLPQRVFVSG